MACVHHCAQESANWETPRYWFFGQVNQCKYNNIQDPYWTNTAQFTTAIHLCWSHWREVWVCMYVNGRKSRKWAQNNRTCWSHYNICVFCNCITLLGWLEFGSGHKYSHWESDQWDIPTECCSTGEYDSADLTSRWKTTSRLAVLKQSQQTLLGGFMTHWQVFPRTQLPEGMYSTCMCF